MNRLQRLTAIHLLLQSRNCITAQEIADRFDITVRTVYRDIRSLETAGVPIGAEPGKGYFLTSGYSLPPVMFSENEAFSMLLMENLSGVYGDQSIESEFKSATSKIKAVLPGEMKSQLEFLSTQIHTSTEHNIPVSPSINLVHLQSAIAKRMNLEINYLSNSKNEVTERKVSPYGLHFYGAHWHLIAYCHLRGGYRDFRADRIKKLKVLDEQFEQNAVKELKTYHELIEKHFSFTKITVRFQPEARRYINGTKHFMGFVKEELHEEYLEMEFNAPDERGFCRWLLMYADAVVSISPDYIARQMQNLVQQIGDHWK